MKTREELNAIAAVVVDASIHVHRALGPGLLESTYQACLAYELRKRGLNVACGLALPVKYESVTIEAGYRIDMLVEDAVIIENKSVQSLAPIHEAQLITYLKLAGLRLGFLINWNVALLKEGLKRMVNEF